MASRIPEFFEDDFQRFSMTRLAFLGAFIVASGIMLLLTLYDKMNEGYFTVYLGTFAGSYLVGKQISKPSTPSSNGQTSVTTESGDINVTGSS